jgi:hypothetical protein
MIDKKIEFDINAVRGFLEYWVKFHSIYSDIVSKENISREEEAKFLETKGLIKGKYDELKSSLEFKYAPRSRLTDPVNDILSTDNMRFMSERNLRKARDDWRDSYIFLNSVLERLENNRRRLERFNPAGVFFKRLFDRSFSEVLREVLK